MVLQKNDANTMDRPENQHGSAGDGTLPKDDTWEDKEKTGKIHRTCDKKERNGKLGNNGKDIGEKSAREAEAKDDGWFDRMAGDRKEQQHSTENVG